MTTVSCKKNFTCSLTKTQELRNKLLGSDCILTVDMNCVFHQFESGGERKHFFEFYGSDNMLRIFNCLVVGV